ncbi:MAG TPA: hypothetical protein VG457_12925 [Planctomycetota bacterium]|nr:hypothetical protein [Planctomycetota bacterium]
MTETFTPVHQLGRWDDGDTPGADGLNGNWDKIDGAMVFYGTAFPATYPLNKIFMRTDQHVLYQNTGTALVPVWTPLSPTGVIKADGSVPMAANLDFGGFKGVNAADPVTAQQLATKNYVDVNGFTNASKADIALGKSFFAAQGLLPATIIREDLYTFAAPDFSNLAGGTLARSMSRARFTQVGNPANFGWNLAGGPYGKVLIILGMVRCVGGFSVGLGVGTTPSPASANLAQGYAAAFDYNSARADIFKGDGAGGNTFLPPSENTVMPPNSANAWDMAMALYVDGGTGRIVFFTRLGSGQWYPFLDITDGTYSTFQCAVFQMFPGGVNWFGCPVGIYAQ